MTAEEEREGNPVATGAEVDLEAVKAEITEEVETLRRTRGGKPWAPDALGGSAPGQSTEDILGILDLEDAAFAREAYQIVLGRPIDGTGYVDVLDRLVDGEPRMDVLWSLAESTEARARGVDAAGLLGERRAATGGGAGRRRSVFRRLASWVVRLRHAPAHITALGHDVRRLSLRLDWLLSQNAALESKSEDRVAQLRQGWEAVSEGLQEQLDVASEQSRELAESSKASELTAQRAIDDVRQLERRLLMDEYRLVDVQERSQHERMSPAPKQTSETSQLMPALADHSRELLYLALEDVFRGTDATMRGRLELYIPHVADCGAGTIDFPAIDIGCGRGEWLQLLGEHGYHARGVDSSMVMTELCRAKGLDVVCADAADYLTRMKPASVGMITAFHVAEHFPFEKLLQIVDLSLSALRPGGVLIMETPNPENMVVATCDFYVDPTHIRLIPPNLLEFLVTARGFGDVEILRLHPLEMVRQGKESGEWLRPLLDRFNCSQDYAVVAVRPALPGEGRGRDESRGGAG